MTAGARLMLFWEFALAALSVGATWPILRYRYLPIGDLPQHLAAVRVLHDFNDPALGFAQFFRLTLFDTQYLAYYLAADVLSYGVNVELANKLLIAASLVAIPYSLRSLLLAQGKDGRLAILSLPLLYNAQLLLGFLNFIAAIPLSLYAVALAVRQRRSYDVRRAIGLGLLALICFYTHVVPFALLLLGVVLVSVQRAPRELGRALLPLLPAGLAAMIWMRVSPAGHATLRAARGAADGPQPEFAAARAAVEQVPRWLTDIFHGERDLQLLAAWTALLVLVFVIALGERLAGLRNRAPDALAHNLGLRLGLLAPLCGVLYFVLPVSYDWIWPIAQRFPLLCALWLLCALPRFRMGRHVVLALAVVISVASFHFAGTAFARFQRDEVGDFDRALAALPPGKRVVGLIFDRGSRNVAFSPFLHYVAYYQARKGGAVMFTFADFPQSPFRFRDDNRPPRVPPRWEWLPERVRPHSELGFYQYALVRGGPGAIARSDSGFSPIYRGERWSVWAARD